MNLMKTKKKPDELSRAGLARVLKNTAAAVRADNLGRGIPMTVVKNDQLIELHPDGSQRFIKQMPPLVRVKKMRFTLE